MPNKVDRPGLGPTDRPRLSLGNREKFDEALSAAGVERTDGKPLPKPNDSGGTPPPPVPPPPR